MLDKKFIRALNAVPRKRRARKVLELVPFFGANTTIAFKDRNRVENWSKNR